MSNEKFEALNIEDGAKDQLQAEKLQFVTGSEEALSGKPTKTMSDWEMRGLQALNILSFGVTVAVNGKHYY
jgi:hypothetical protein